MSIRKTSISEPDYLSILDIHHRLVKCTCFDSLYECFQGYFLPLIDCESIAFGWRDIDLGAKQVRNVNIFGFVGITREDADFFAKITPYCKTSNELLLSGSRSVIACDVDIPWEAYKRDADLYSRDHPEYHCPPNALCVIRGKSMRTIMFAIDRFENGLGMAVHRYLPNDKPFSPRDVRVVELVRPILFQTIKNITLSEELAKHKILAESLANIPAGVALVRSDMRVVFLNKAFHEQIPLEPGHKLPANLEFAIRNKMNRILNLKVLPDTVPNQPFYELPGGTFRLSIDQVNKGDDGACYLLRLKATNDAYSQLGIKMQGAELSNREKEICCLVKDGFGNEQIGERLFISRHTVKTHMKNIYKKFFVPTRSKLVALLNQTTQLS